MRISQQRKEEQGQPDELTTAPIPCPPVPLQGRRKRKSGIKLSLGGRNWWRESVLRFSCILHYPILI